jgi:hypothetical protein
MFGTPSSNRRALGHAFRFCKTLPGNGECSALKRDLTAPGSGDLPPRIKRNVKKGGISIFARDWPENVGGY